MPVRDLADPGPDEATLHAILSGALRVPDHGLLEPWRLHVLDRDAQRELCQSLSASLVLAGEPEREHRSKKLQSILAIAPLLIVVSTHLRHGHKVPIEEQLLSCGALCMNILLAAWERGFSSQWLTGWLSTSPEFRDALDIPPAERVVGNIFIGTSVRPAEERRRPDLARCVTRISVEQVRARAVIPSQGRYAPRSHRA